MKWQAMCHPSPALEGMRSGSTLDGDVPSGVDVPLLADGRQHNVRVLMGESGQL
jgi:hypothetical protein